MLGGMATGKTALEAFDKMEEKVMSMEAESEAAVAVSHLSFHPALSFFWGCKMCVSYFCVLFLGLKAVVWQLFEVSG